MSPRQARLECYTVEMSAVCSHLESVEVTALPADIAGCEDCLASGLRHRAGQYKDLAAGVNRAIGLVAIGPDRLSRRRR